jgi:hypothetical protein
MSISNPKGGAMKTAKSFNQNRISLVTNGNPYAPDYTYTNTDFESNEADFSAEYTRELRDTASGAISATALHMSANIPTETLAETETSAQATETLPNNSNLFDSVSVETINYASQNPGYVPHPGENNVFSDEIWQKMTAEKDALKERAFAMFAQIKSATQDARNQDEAYVTALNIVQSDPSFTEMVPEDQFAKSVLMSDTAENLLNFSYMKTARYNVAQKHGVENDPTIFQM